MASITPYTTKSGKRWRVQYRDPAGKVRSKRGFTRKTDAQTWADKNAVAVADGQWTDPARGKRTITDLWPAWWATKQHLEPGSLAVMEPSWKNTSNQSGVPAKSTPSANRKYRHGSVSTRTPRRQFGARSASWLAFSTWR